VKVVVKIGGVALDDPIVRRKCATAVAHLVEDGHKVAVVHGGGITLTRMMERLAERQNSSMASALPTPRRETSP